MRYLLPLMLIAAPLATPAVAQDLSGYGIAGDVGLGAEYGPGYLGSDDNKTSPWLILRNGTLIRPGQTADDADGFSILPSFGYQGRRDAKDYDALAGMKDIKRAGEVGLKVGYDMGPTSSYLTLRKGFGGHSGLTGEFGASYRIDASDKLSFWGNVEAQYGNKKFNDTYFGVTPEESLTSRYGTYSAGGGIYGASIGLEARYSLTEKTAIVGEVEYQRLLGDSGDSPLVQDKNQPSVKLGIVRHFDFRF
ncbi:MipA/OmpV family protein [Paracoccus aminophilus]|uniref:MltA-interacting MipA n=1 Tax=Paracoccus aminophilus JCM 7686 TaxID=1367847 RepID=S5XPF7_PARAH|nr:MipA/OmpV family protein [Paracoccus aminophilus]AGT09219.1 MltA-interacting MipA [Paracoccus aminophilus JCM 7686]